MLLIKKQEKLLAVQDRTTHYMNQSQKRKQGHTTNNLQLEF